MGYEPSPWRDDFPARLSLWEIAHRWENENPLADTISSLKVADRLRWMLRALAEEEEARRAANTSGESEVVHRDLAQELESLNSSINTGKPNVDQLKDWDVVFISIVDICRDRDEPLPSFWFDTARTDPVKPEKKRHNASRQSEVIALAKQLYEENPELTRPAHMIEHPEMKALLAGISVADKTKRGWISKAKKQPAPKGRQKKPQQ